MSKTVWLPTRAMRGLIEATNDAIVITTARDLDRPGPAIVYANPAFCRLAGYGQAEMLGRSPRILQGPGTDARTLARIRKALEAGSSFREEVLNYTKAGEPYWLDIRIVPLFGEDGALEYFGAIERDVTERRRASERLRRLAHADILTGIGNRASLQHHLEAVLVPAGDAALHFMLVDLDGLRAVNDTLGHPAGDVILRHFAARLVAALRRDDFVARLAGDEFVVVLKGHAEEEAAALAQRVIGGLATLDAPGADLVGASVGVAPFAAGEEFWRVHARADVACRRAKAAGRGMLRVAGPAPRRGRAAR